MMAAEHAKKERDKTVRQGISIRNLDLLLGLLTLAISVTLLYATYRTNAGYQDMREETTHLQEWAHAASDLQIASDYLTEQVRCFAETGNRQYLDNYFEEAHVTRRRDHALEYLQDFLGGTEAYTALEKAMAESVSLMDREYYSMRLTIAAYGLNVANFPEEIQGVQLKKADANLRKSNQEALARDMVFDSTYHEKKVAISANMQNCLDDIQDQVDAELKRSETDFARMLTVQRVLIIVTIAVMTAAMLFTLLLVISPLLRAVVYIRADEPIPIKGSHEFQFLARTYNLMYESNREQKEHLAFEATHDALTGIYNRSGYDFLVKNTDWETSALLLFDVDRFKGINDTHGHETGDHLLQKVAAALKNSFRSQDYVCRIGGDEFAVILVHVGDTAVPRILQKVDAINSALRDKSDGVPAVTISCGGAFGAGETDFENIFRHADEVLYQVKRAGGGSCKIA